MSFERKTEPLLPRRVFIRRVLLYAGFSVTILGVSLAVGILGYHFTEGLSWIDSLLNASMILGGMGPVDGLHTEGGKLFASFYALFSGMVFLVAIGVLIAPVVHRLMHSFHFAPEDIDEVEQDDHQTGQQKKKQQKRRRG